MINPLTCRFPLVFVTLVTQIAPKSAENMCAQPGRLCTPISAPHLSHCPFFLVQQSLSVTNKMEFATNRQWCNGERPKRTKPSKWRTPLDSIITAWPYQIAALSLARAGSPLCQTQHSALVFSITYSLNVLHLCMWRGRLWEKKIWLLRVVRIMKWWCFG